MVIPDDGQAGYWCRHGRHWCDHATLLPLDGRRKVQAPPAIQLGDVVGNCHLHLSHVYYLRRDDRGSELAAVKPFGPKGHRS